MSWNGNAAIHIKRSRMEMLDRRTQETVLPTVEEIFDNADDLEPEMAIDVVDKIYFSTFPGAKQGGAAALRSFLTNDSNAQILKDSGAVGSVIEMLHRLDLAEAIGTEHLYNLVWSLHLMVMGDKSIQIRILKNIHAVPILFELSLLAKGEIQQLVFDLICELSYCDSAIQQFLSHDIMSVLFSKELMYAQSTFVKIKHDAVNLVYRIVQTNARLFPVEYFEDVLLTETGVRRIDGHMEVVLLNCLLLYANHYKNKFKMYFNREYLFMKHFISEVLNETFEDLDHMQNIMKIVYIQSENKVQVKWMLENDLQTMLQLVIKTDFSLMRRKQGSGNLMKQSMASLNSNTDKKKKGKIDNRPLQTKMALAMVRPVKTAATKSDDINYIVGRMAVQIYSNLIIGEPEIIAQLVSSGLIPALLFRVGASGDVIDWRSNHFVLNFLFLILTTVINAQSDNTEHIGLVIYNQKRDFYADYHHEPDAKVGRSVIKLRKKTSATSYKDLNLISETLAAHGVLDLFKVSIFRNEEPDVIQKGCLCLCYMEFHSIASIIYQPDILMRLIYLSQRNECFYPCLCTIVNVILYPDLDVDRLDIVMKSIPVPFLVRAYYRSGWYFHLKALVYKALAILSVHPIFKGQIIDCEGFGLLLTILHMRKKAIRQRKKDVDAGPDDSTELLLKQFRPDWAISRIQSMVRVFLTKRKVAAFRTKKEIEKNQHDY